MLHGCRGMSIRDTSQFLKPAQQDVVILDNQSIGGHSLPVELYSESYWTGHRIAPLGGRLQ